MSSVAGAAGILAAAADELSLTSYLEPRAIPNLFQGGKVTSGLSSLRLVEGSSNGGDDVGAGMGKSGGVPDDGASDLVWESMMGGVMVVNGVVVEKESEAVVMTMGKVRW
ncbi:hypothetical protein Tco_0422322 [Tanacetum coccineum]